MTTQTPIGRERRLIVDDLRRACIPERYWNVKLRMIPDNMPYKEPFKIYLRDILEMLENGIGLYLFSRENSSGKTSMLVLALKRAMQLRHTAFFINAEEFKVAAARGESFDEAETVYDRTKRVDLLGIDDIGTEYRTESGYAERLLENIIRYRMQNLKTTLMTGNVEAKDLKKVYSQSLTEMLMECARPIHVLGESEGGLNWRKQREKEVKNMFKPGFHFGPGAEGK